MLTTPGPTSCEVLSREFGKNRTGVVLQVRGGIDLTTATTLSHAIRRSLAGESISNLVVDLHDASHIDSSGIGVLLEGLRHANRVHVHFILCGLCPAVRHVFERTRLHLVFDIRRTIEEAGCVQEAEWNKPSFTRTSLN